MSHAIHRIERFDIVGPYTLSLDFADGTRREIDFRPVLEGQVLGALQDLEVFNAVWLEPDTGILEWPNGADFDPETLRNTGRAGSAALASAPSTRHRHHVVAVARPVPLAREAFAG